MQSIPIPISVTIHIPMGFPFPSHSWDIVVTTSVRMNKQMNGVDGQSENMTSLPILGQQRHNKLYQPSPSVEHTFVNRFSAVSTKESFHFSDIWRHTKISLTTFITNWFTCLTKAAEQHQSFTSNMWQALFRFCSTPSVLSPNIVVIWANWFLVVVLSLYFTPHHTKTKPNMKNIQPNQI